jgi:hypothetical protein
LAKREGQAGPGNATGAEPMALGDEAVEEDNNTINTPDDA